jgi:hypothetical protein
VFVIYRFYNKWFQSIDLYFILLLIFEMIKNFSKCIYTINRMKHPDHAYVDRIGRTSVDLLYV